MDEKSRICEAANDPKYYCNHKTLHSAQFYFDRITRHLNALQIVLRTNYSLSECHLADSILIN